MSWPTGLIPRDISWSALVRNKKELSWRLGLCRLIGQLWSFQELRTLEIVPCQHGILRFGKGVKSCILFLNSAAGPIHTPGNASIGAEVNGSETNLTANASDRHGCH